MSIRDKAREASGKRRWLNHDDPYFGPMIIRSMTAGERMALEWSKAAAGGGVNEAEIELIGPRTIVATVCDVASKEQEFDAADLPMLAAIDDALLSPLLDVINRHVKNEASNDQDEAGNSTAKKN